jgi:hypothetical protein
LHNIKISFENLHFSRTTAKAPDQIIDPFVSEVALEAVVSSLKNNRSPGIMKKLYHAI